MSNHYNQIWDYWTLMAMGKLWILCTDSGNCKAHLLIVKSQKTFGCITLALLATKNQLLAWECFKVLILCVFVKIAIILICDINPDLEDPVGNQKYLWKDRFLSQYCALSLPMFYLSYGLIVALAGHWLEHTYYIWQYLGTDRQIIFMSVRNWPL